MTRESQAEVWEEFVRLWSGFLDESRSPGTRTVVEGDRDRAALRRLGVTGTIVLVHQGRRLASTSQRLLEGADRVIVLTDWDLEGGQIARRLADFLKGGPVELDLEWRRRLARVLRGELVHVEGLFGWARRMAERSGAPLDHFLSGTSA
ncbi:MAG TPA: toprim domain-containing protein [Thermoplasmata archaeon]|nr:toprim domain-containing protein [Thermoplasmata archaeon]